MPRYALADTVAGVLLCGVALAGFWSTFAGSGWLVIGASGIAVGMAWSLLLLALGSRLEIVLGSLSVPYLVTAGALALGSWVPDGATLREVLVGSATSVRELVETAPPLDSAGPVMLVPYLLGLAGAGASAALGMGTRGPALPALPPLVVLSVVLLLGLHEPVSVLVQGVLFAAIALLWIAHRGLRIEAGGEAAVATARVSPSRLVGGTVVLALVSAATVALTGLGGGGASVPDRLHLREAVAPYDSPGHTTPLTIFRRFREQPATALANLAHLELFRFEGAAPGSRVRIAVLDDYDGQRWVAGADRAEDDHTDRFLRVSTRVDNPAHGAARAHTVRVRHRWELPWVPVVGALQTFDFAHGASQPRRDHLRLNRSTDTALLPGGLERGEDYVFTSVRGDDRLSALMEAWPTPDESLHRAAAFLDVPARAWSAGTESSMQAVLSIAAQLKARGRYSDGAFGWETEFEPGHDRARLDRGFINAPQMVGNDEQYAAAMALLANRVGVPARVAVGAVLGRDRVIRGSDISAWVELRVSDGSWRVLPTDAFMGNEPPDPGAEPLMEVKVPPKRKPEPEQAQEEHAPPPDAEQDQTPPEPSPESPEDAGPSAWLLLLPLPLALAAVPVLKLLRRRRRRHASPASHAYAGGWADLLDTARDLGVAVPSAATRPAQAAVLGVPVSLARAADVATFTPGEPAPPGPFWAEVAAARRVIAGTVPRWRRLLAPINPASLLRP